MKTTYLKHIAMGVLLSASLGLTSCRNGNQTESTNDADEINGEIYGKGTDADMEESGTRSGTTMDTVQTDTNNGRSGAANGQSNGNDEPVLNGNDGNPVLGPKSPKDDGGSMGSGQGNGTGNGGNNTTEINPK
jgi:hypothetical protein